MKILSTEEVFEILRKHDLWRAGDSVHGRKANFSNTDISYMGFYNRDLRGVDFIGAKCMGTRFSRCWLNDADFTDANLNLAQFLGCMATDADFSFANMTHATIKRSSFNNITVRDANLTEVEIAESSVFNVWFAAAKNVEDDIIPLNCPESGSFRAYKKVVFPVLEYYPCSDAYMREWREAIAVLEIPENAKRTSSTGMKCRASEAKVIEFLTLEGKPMNISVAKSKYDRNFVYVKGATVRPELPFNDTRWSECTSGIHFFMRFKDAVNY